MRLIFCFFKSSYVTRNNGKHFEERKDDNLSMKREFWIESRICSSQEKDMQSSVVIFAC